METNDKEIKLTKWTFQVFFMSIINPCGYPAADRVWKLHLVYDIKEMETMSTFNLYELTFCLTLTATGMFEFVHLIVSKKVDFLHPDSLVRGRVVCYGHLVRFAIPFTCGFIGLHSVSPVWRLAIVSHCGWHYIDSCPRVIAIGHL